MARLSDDGHAAPAALDEWERLARAAAESSVAWPDAKDAILYDDWCGEWAEFIAMSSPERILGLIAAARRGADDSAVSVAARATVNAWVAERNVLGSGGFLHGELYDALNRSLRLLAEALNQHTRRAAAPEERDDAC